MKEIGVESSIGKQIIFEENQRAKNLYYLVQILLTLFIFVFLFISLFLLYLTDYRKLIVSRSIESLIISFCSTFLIFVVSYVVSCGFFVSKKQLFETTSFLFIIFIAKMFIFFVLTFLLFYFLTLIILFKVDLHIFQQAIIKAFDFLFKNYIDSVQKEDYMLFQSYINNLKWIYVLYIPGAIAWFSVILTLSHSLLRGLRKRIGVDKEKNAYLYLLYFLRAIIIKHPFPFFIGFFIHLFLLLFPSLIILFPQYLFEYFHSVATDVSYISFLLSTLILFLTPIFYAYYNLYESYEIYSMFHAKAKILDRLNNHYLIFGYGNLGTGIIKHVIKYIFCEFNNNQMKLKKTMKRHFSVIIDNNLKFKVIASNLAIINKNEEIFTQIFQTTTGIRYGFLPSPKDKDLWLLGIPGDAGNIANLEAVNYKNAKLIINATPDLELPLKIFNNIKDKKCILCVPDSSSYFSLFHQTLDKEIFLLFPTITGTISLANAMFMVLEKMKSTKRKDFMDIFKQIDYKFLIITGTDEGRSLFYLLERFKSLLSHELSFQEDKIEFFKNALIVLSNDKRIKEANPAEQEGWNVSLDRYGKNIYYRYKIPFVSGNPFDVDTFVDILKRYPEIYLIVIFSRTPFETVKILNTILNALMAIGEASYPKDTKLPLILVSSPNRENEIIKEKLERYSNVYKYNDKIYPTQRDLILVHDYTIWDEIASIFRAWEEIPKNSHKNPFLLSLCIKDSPGTLLKTLLLLAGFDITGINHHRKCIPSFHASNTVLDRDNPQVYIYDGLASLEPLLPEKDFLRGMLINSGKENLEEAYNNLLKLLEIKNLKLLPSVEWFNCPKHCSICPISIVSNTFDFESLGLYEPKHLLLFEDVRDASAKIKKNNHYARIWIYADHSNVPGALAIGLKDLLLIPRTEIKKKEGIRKVVNIKYVSNIECPEFGNATLRNIYGVLENREEKEMDKIIKEGTLQAVCIKASCLEVWEKYINDLLDFLNNNYSNQFILHRKIKSKFPYCYLILKKDLDDYKKERILRKIEIFWKPEKIKDFL